MARFSGPCRRLPARSSSKVTSRTQWRLFSIAQWPWTARAKRSGVRVEEEVFAVIDPGALGFPEQVAISVVN